MRIAEYIDTSNLKDELRPWFINHQSEVLELLRAEEARVSSHKEKREVSSSSQPGLRRRRKKEEVAPRSSLDVSDPLEKVCLQISLIILLQE